MAYCFLKVIIPVAFVPALLWLDDQIAMVMSIVPTPTMICANNVGRPRMIGNE